MKIDVAISDASSRQDAFRSAMRMLAAGVSIVAAGNEDERSGITVSSVTSLAIDPPTLVVCIGRNSSLAPALDRYGHFSANLLRASQRDLAERFAGRGGVFGAERFAAGDWITLITGAPVLSDALASIDCEIEEKIDRHTHSIVLGRVVAVRAAGRGDALAHWRGGFRALEDGTGQ